MNEMLAFLEFKLSGGAASAEVLAEIRAAKELRQAREAGASRDQRLRPGR